MTRGPDVDVAILEDVGGSPIEELAERWTVTFRPNAWKSADELDEVVRGAKAVVVRNRTQVTRGLLCNAPQLRIVARAGVGLENIDLAAADEQGVVVSAPLGANAVSVAEHAMGLALALARKTVQLDAACRSGQWQRTPGAELAGQTWGLLGAGTTARATGRLAKSFGMRVIAYDPYVESTDPGLLAVGVSLRSLDELVAESDVLSCHLPSSNETQKMVDAEFISHMRSHALLVSVGRGDVVDEEALAEALARGHLGGAALDVRETEPPVEGRLEQCDRVILTPHIAGITTQSQSRILKVLCSDIDAVLNGRPARSAVGSVQQAASVY